MQAEREVVRFLSAYQTIWHAHFPSLFRRAQWHIVTHLCTSGREGAAVGELYGLVKQVFLLDDSTVKERILEIKEQQLCVVDPPNARAVGTFGHRARHRRCSSCSIAICWHWQGACATAATLDPATRARSHRAGSMPQQRGIILQSLNRCREPWRAGAGSHLRRDQSVARAPCRGDPASQLAVALDAAAHGGRAALRRVRHSPAASRASWPIRWPPACST